jgi:hypothetical protein
MPWALSATSMHHPALVCWLNERYDAMTVWRSAKTAVLILFTLILVACSPKHTDEQQSAMSDQNRVTGEYVVTVHQDGDAEVLREVFRSYSVEAIQRIAHHQYLVKLRNDPGPEKVRREGMQSTFVRDVQPNYVYRANPMK